MGERYQVLFHSPSGSLSNGSKTLIVRPTLETGDVLSDVDALAIGGVLGFLNLHISMKVPTPGSSALPSITISFDSWKSLQFMSDGAAIIVH